VEQENSSISRVRGRKAIRDIELRGGGRVRNAYVAAAAQSGTGIVPRRGIAGALKVRRDEGDLLGQRQQSQKQTQRTRRPPKKQAAARTL